MKIKIKWKNSTLFLLLSLFLIWVDRYSKNLAVRFLSSGKEIVLIRNILHLVYVENRGAAFGIFQGQQVFFLCITFLVIFGLFVFINSIPLRQRYLPIFFVCILIFSGAIGNLIDRMSNAYVVDFIYFKLIDFPIFNFADICITCGCFLLAFLLIFFYKEDEFRSPLQ